MILEHLSLVQCRTPWRPKTLLFTIVWAACFLANVFPLPAAEYDWYRWRGPHLNGVSLETGWLSTWPKDGPKQLWKASVGAGFSSVSVSQGRVYTMGNNDGTESVSCLESESGKEIWKHSYPSPLDDHYYEGGTSVTPTVDGDAVYSLSKRGQLFCFEAATGQVKWSRNLPQETGVKIPEWGFAGSPLIQGHLLILNAGSAGLALNKANGKVLWSTGQDAAGYGSAVPFAMGDQRAVAIFAAKHIVGVNIKNGEELWRHPWKTSYDVNAADPIIAGDKVFLSSGYGAGCGVIQFGPGQTSLVWKNKTMRNHFNSCVLVGDYIYGIDGQAEDEHPPLRCLDFKTGAVKWSEPIPGTGTLMAAEGKLIVLAGRGELIIAEAAPARFHALARAQVLGGKCWAAPVLSNGRIYCRNGRGDLVCLDVQGKLSTQSR